MYAVSEMLQSAKHAIFYPGALLRTYFTFIWTDMPCNSRTGWLTPELYLRRPPAYNEDGD